MSHTTQQTIEPREITIRAGRRTLAGTLTVPAEALGAVVFAHGSGSSRFSPRNRFVARQLQEGRLATLLLDLLEEEETQDRENVFNIPLLAERLQVAATWMREQPSTRALRLGFFGASTGAAAALVAAAQVGDAVGAVVSRGGRPDLATTALPLVTAPTLLLVGGNDEIVLELNEQAYRALRCPRQLVVIPGATHLFPEPGALEEVARLARNWFSQYLASANQPVAAQG